MHAGRELAGQPIFHEAQQVEACALSWPLSVAVENSNGTLAP
jgi:hypothetical protein